MKKAYWLCCIWILGGAAIAYAQSTQNVISEMAQVYTGSSDGKSLMGGFSMWGLIWTVIFNGIGFIAFVYGKKNSEFKPLITGIVLMGYPLFVKDTIMILVVGVVLTVVLYYWRD